MSSSGLLPVDALSCTGLFSVGGLSCSGLFPLSLCLAMGSFSLFLSFAIVSLSPRKFRFHSLGFAHGFSVSNSLISNRCLCI